AVLRGAGKGGGLMWPDTPPAAFAGEGLDESSTIVEGNFKDGNMTLFAAYGSAGGPKDPHGVEVRCYGESNTSGTFTDMMVGFVRIQALEVTDVAQSQEHERFVCA